MKCQKKTCNSNDSNLLKRWANRNKEREDTLWGILVWLTLIAIVLVPYTGDIHF